MYRFLLTPRWWALNIFTVLSIVVCVVLGSWQLSRFEARVDSHKKQQNRASDAQEAEAAPLRKLLPVTKETSGRLATVTGRYDAEHQLLVPDRRLDDRTGFYVLTLLRTDAGGGAGQDAAKGAGREKALPVVRGWLPGDADDRAATAKVPAPPSGEVTVTGALQASENRGTDGVRAEGGLPEGQLGMISAASLINVVPYDVYDAWVTSSKTTGALRPVPPAAAEGTGLDLKAFQNLGYTGEWFVFVGFVLFMWFRLFRRDAEAARDLALGIVPADAGTPAPTAAGSSDDEGADATPAAPGPRKPADSGAGSVSGADSAPSEDPAASGADSALEADPAAPGAQPEPAASGADTAPSGAKPEPAASGKASATSGAGATTSE
ncbi:SURF1 family protein [Streptomyces sp. LX-29]|uniref:SURF1 family protein n=1 Tax=Streptomyces sp. LX-29 TaxID=2900152 RepID=UPI00240DAF96|nr:SURF1 family cytochrome oxidase biogenesis protein [Streptomyces sp. LX-29]WFB08256.1 SURF1 family protein [Streptomyces sp. LX-29]